VTAAKKEAKAPKAAKKEVEVKAPVPEATEPKAPASRGPRGVPEDAVITVNAATNPKREGSKAFALWTHYENGMTVKAYCDAVGAEATPALVYDAKKGFITIAGYDVPGGVEAPKVKEPKEPKPAKEPKARKQKAPDAEAAGETAQEVLELETEEEVV
jgi:hypothetical protein